MTPPPMTVGAPPTPVVPSTGTITASVPAYGPPTANPGWAAVGGRDDRRPADDDVAADVAPVDGKAPFGAPAIAGLISAARSRSSCSDALPSVAATAA